MSSNSNNTEGGSTDNIMEEIKKDMLAADLRLSLFAGAVNSFKYESLLKPVPASFKNEYGEVDVDRLRQLVSKIPSFPLDNNACLDGNMTDLLKSVLLNTNYYLSSITPSQLRDTLSDQAALMQLTPDWIFQINHNASRTEIWERKKAGHASFFAFHGSRFENFHSILNLGLHQHLNKTSLFGEGIYLSTEQSLSLHYSPCGEGWCKSQLGREMSILALCEVVDHPDVKRQSKKSRTSPIPEKYILVTNNELVRPRFLLVYAASRKNSNNNKIGTACLRFLQKHKFVLFLGFYVSLLLAIGLSK